MKTSIVELFSQGKSRCGYSEDRLVEGASFYGVLDGSPGPFGGGREMITEILDRAVALLGQMPLPEEVP